MLLKKKIYRQTFKFSTNIINLFQKINLCKNIDLIIVTSTLKEPVQQFLYKRRVLLEVKIQTYLFSDFPHFLHYQRGF